MDGNDKAGINNESSTSKQIAEAKKKMETLSLNSSHEFMVGLKEIAKEFDEKSAAVEERMIASRDQLGGKLDELRDHKRDLLLLKESVICLRDEYLSNAKRVVDIIREKDPQILERLEQIAVKQNALKRLQLRKEGESIVESLQKTAEKDFSSEVFAEMEHHLDRFLQHDKELSEFDVAEWKHFSASEIGDKLTAKVRVKLCVFLEQVLKFPFEEDDMKFITEENEKSVRGFLRILYRLSSLTADESGMDNLAVYLFEPIRDRFIYHFYGSRRTNDKANPRWFLTQLLSWTTACGPFYERILTAVARDFGHGKQQFTRNFHYQISQLAVKKIASLLSDEEVIEDSHLFSTLVDDVVVFEEQRQHLDIGGFGENALSPFCEAQIIGIWTSIENESSSSRVDDILSQEDRWKSRMGEFEDVDEYNVCRGVDAFVTLVTCLRNRISMLPDPVAKRQFIDLQLFLFDDFLQRLTQIRNTAESPWMEPFPQIMNGIWYLCDTVQEWNDSTLFFEISGTSSSLDNTSRMYKHVWSQMADAVVDSVRAKTIDLTHQYQQQRWASVEPLSSGMREISPLFCPLLMQIRSSFASAAGLISKASVAALFKRMTAAVADVVMKEVLAPSTFVELGASQMLFDIEQGLLPVLSHIFLRTGLDGMNPEYNEKVIKLIGSLRVLSLSWPVASLLREELSNTSTEVVEEKLAEMKITGLSPDDVLRLFDQRSDMKSGNFVMKVR